MVKTSKTTLENCQWTQGNKKMLATFEQGTSELIRRRKQLDDENLA